MRYLKSRTKFRVFILSITLGLAGSSSLFASEPKRIIPLLPSLAEIAVDILGSDERIAGVSEYSDFPTSLKKKTSIGPFSKPNLETIVSLHPDLILASSEGSPPEVIGRLKALGFKVLSVGTESVAQVRESYVTLGAAFGREREAALAVTRFDSELSALKERSKKRSEAGGIAKPNSLRVLVQVGDEPLYVAGGKSFLNEALELVGVKNIYSDAKSAYPRASVEDVIRRDPEMILLVSLGNDLRPFERAQKKWESYPTLAAVKKRQIKISRSDALVRPGPRFPAGVRELELLIFSGGTTR